MADKKKDAGHEGGGEWLGITLEVVIAFAILAVVIYGFKQPFSPTFLNIDYVFGGMLVFFQSIFTYQVGSAVSITVGIICVFLIALNFYLFLRLLEMEEEHEDHVYHHAEDHTKPLNLLKHVLSDVRELGRDIAGAGQSAATGTASVFDRMVLRDEADLFDKSTNTPDATYLHEVDEKEGSSKWRMVEKHIISKNPSDWKIAIIEADTILDALVERAGFPGDSLGERLKNADKGVFRTLDFAWEAHKVRNRIAHEGSNFNLSERDAKTTIKQYEEVFREFGYI
jgi:hypothetical protein